MDQTKMLENIIKETNMTGAKDEHLPTPMTGISLSKLDNSTPEDKSECDKYPYRKVIGMLMYCLVHTGITYMYALNVLSRYCNNPGKRHIEFLKHLLRYIKWTAKDRLFFRAHPGPRTKEQIQESVTLVFYADADLAGNPDTRHSQTGFIGKLGGNVICYGSTDQGSISTSTAESEIKAVNFTLKAEVIACRGILIAMGFPQPPTVIYEDNQACVYASKHEHMTKNLRHLELTEMWFKQKVTDGTCVLVKIDSKLNIADIGTKRLNNPLFADLTCSLVDRSLRKNL
jgi:hypothetical protein